MVPKVSVIVPNYNHARYLKMRLDSIVNQTFQDFEIIILDDVSTDNSRELIEQYRSNPKVSRVVYNTQNSGSTFAQWERGLMLAKGEWIWLAESDDYAEPTFLETLLNLAAEQDNVGIAFANSHWVDHRSEIKESLSLYKESFFRTGLDEIKDGMCKHCTIQNASSTLIKREHALKAVTNLSKFKACGDWIFYTRILHNSNIVYTAQPLNYFRWYHPSVSDSGTNKKQLWYTEGVQVLENIDFNKVKFSLPAYLKMVRRWGYKALRLNFKDSVKAWFSIANASLNYLHLKH